jgi:hypothetical protein
MNLFNSLAKQIGPGEIGASGVAPRPALDSIAGDKQNFTERACAVWKYDTSGPPLAS